MTKILVTILILYLLYKLIFDFVVPVAKTTTHFKSQVNEMRRMQEEQLRSRQGPAAQRPAETPKTSPEKSTTTTDGEYIDFEDVK